MSGHVFHAPLIDHHPGFVLLGAWERSTKRLMKSYPSARSYESLDELLLDPDVDLVVVNTPTATHHEFAKNALQHDKHVVVEKAFTDTKAEAVELRELAARQNRKLAVFQNRRWDSDFLSVREIVRREVLGDIVEANLAYSRYGPELSPKNHKETPGSGSGIVKDLGPHVIDQALVLFGVPDAVFADIGVTRDGTKVDDYFDILLLYADKRVHVKGGYFYLHPVPEYTLFGKQGCFLKRRSDPQEVQLGEGMNPGDDRYGMEPESSAGRLYTAAPNQADTRTILSPRGNYLAFYDGLYRSIADDTNEPVTADDGVRVMQVIDAAFESHREGRLIQIEPDA
ncbi:MAG: Gfo/Idh/MocA family oxidoreductase [Gammaproteobacteria bacterium]|nr:Gfo/Idh/MocA family oxidoreductase [Gammaproteobacteria bacterium]